MTEPSAHSIWLRPERAGRGPTPTFDRDRIAAAGIALADADGLPAVTMRAVAVALGAGRHPSTAMWPPATNCWN